MNFIAVQPHGGGGLDFSGGMDFSGGLDFSEGLDFSGGTGFFRGNWIFEGEISFSGWNQTFVFSLATSATMKDQVQRQGSEQMCHLCGQCAWQTG